MSHFAHLGSYSDLVSFAREHHAGTPWSLEDGTSPAAVRSVLGFHSGGEAPGEVTTVDSWERDGVRGEEVSWSLGYGPPTHAYVLRPSASSGPLPGVVALHAHEGFKYHGKEKIADTAQETSAVQTGLRDIYYEGRAFANDLARSGFVVLVHDVFAWGSRRFPYAEMPPQIRDLGLATRDLTEPDPTPSGTPTDIATYNATARHHEHLIEKYCALLGTTLAGVISYEDRVAAAYLASRPDVAGDGVGCVGLSGGGCRAALLHATSERMRAAVCVGMMSTYHGLLDHNVVGHTWMLLPPSWARLADWPDLAAARAPSPLLVQYNRDDPLFTSGGMRDADEAIAEHFRRAGEPDAYSGRFYDGPHKFDQVMQEEAFAWLHLQLDATATDGPAS